MHWHGTYSGEFLGELATLFRTVTLYQKRVRSNQREGKENGGLIFYLLLGGWCLCLPCDPHILPVISRAQEVCDLWITVKWVEINKSGAGGLTGTYCCKDRKWVWNVVSHPFSKTMGKFAMILGKSPVALFNVLKWIEKKWWGVFKAGISLCLFY